MLISMGSKLGKFAPERALQTAVTTQHDLKQDYYDGNSFDIGELEATPLSILSKFPQATIAGLVSTLHMGEQQHCDVTIGD